MKTLYIACLSLVLVSFNLNKQEELPPTNKKVMEYVNSVIGKKVDKGECWDLANQALTYANAKWTFPNTFGKPYDYKKKPILPGDLVQLSNVTIENKYAYSTSTITMPKHTVIVYSVEGNGKIHVAEQNFNNIKKVVISEWNLNNVTKGKLSFYRPVPL